MFPDTGPDPSLQAVVDEAVDRWRAGAKPDALSVLNAYPGILERHSLAVDLAYEEYCLREESGESPDPQQFCNKFSQFGYSLARMLQLHSVLRSKSSGFAPKKPTNWPAIGNQWLDWKLLEEIGRGAFSRVFIAEEPSLGHRRVVVKCSTSGGGEAFVLGKFNHPNLMLVHSIRHDQERDLVGICMPLVGRITLAQVLDRLGNSDPASISAKVFSPLHGAWPADSCPGPLANAPPYVHAVEVARLIERVARGLASAHHAGVLHGDIKPSNIILSFEGQPLLVDFNLSSGAQEHPERLGGTPPYMAPERLKLLSLTALKTASLPAELDFRSDIFSLGAVLCELLIRQTPHEVDAHDDAISYRPNQPLLPGQRDVAGQLIPATLLEIVRRSTSMNPADRFASATEFADTLANFICSQTPPAPRTGNVAWRAGAVIAATLIIVPLLASSYSPSPALPPPAPPQTAPPTEPVSRTFKTLSLAIEDMEQGDFIYASERLEEVQRSRPHPLIEAWIGYCFVQMEKFPLAKAHFELAQPDSDATGTLWHNIGYCEFLAAQMPAAIAAFDRAIEQNPQSCGSWRYRAVAKYRHARQKKTPLPPGTEEDIERALQLGPEQPYLYVDAARIYASAGSEREIAAEMCVRRALAAGVPLNSLEGSHFPRSQLEKFSPAVMPAEIKPPKITSHFLPPSAPLRAILDSYR